MKRRGGGSKIAKAAVVLGTVAWPTHPAAGSPVSAAPSMELTVVVEEADGIYPGTCTGTTSITVEAGTQVEFCYLMRNTGTETLTLNDLGSDPFGPVLTDIPTQLEPGESLPAYSVETVSATVTNTATWSATGVGNGFLGHAMDSVTVTVPPVDPDLEVVAESAAFSVDMTVMVDDGTDTCGTDHAAIVEKETMLRFCYTMTNTGNEALNVHDIRDSHIGQIAGPSLDQLVLPGDGLVFTATGSFNVSALHGLTWEVTGADSGTVVLEFDGLNVTVLGPEITLDMTVMVDDGHGTCGTEDQLSVAPGTQVLYCYTMTDTGDEPVNYHDLEDDQLGPLLDSLDREVEPGDTLVHTEVAVINETVTNNGYWSATAQGTGPYVDATDSVTVEVDPDGATTTTTTATTTVADVCVTTPVPTAAPTNPPTTSPPTSPASTTTSSPSTSTTNATTSTTTPSFITTTSTTSPVIVLLTTTTTLGEPAGFRGAHRPLAPPPCPGEGTPGGGGSQLPATGAPVSVLAVLATLAVVLGGVALATVRARGRDTR